MRNLLLKSHFFSEILKSQKATRLEFELSDYGTAIFMLDIELMIIQTFPRRVVPFPDILVSSKGARNGVDNVYNLATRALSNRERKTEGITRNFLAGNTEST